VILAAARSDFCRRIVRRASAYDQILEEDVTAFWLFNIDSTTGKLLMSK
jgi:hypothetical protein